MEWISSNIRSLLSMQFTIAFTNPKYYVSTFPLCTRASQYIGNKKVCKANIPSESFTMLVAILARRRTSTWRVATIANSKLSVKKLFCFLLIPFINFHSVHSAFFLRFRLVIKYVEWILMDCLSHSWHKYWTASCTGVRRGLSKGVEDGPSNTLGSPWPPLAVRPC
jgi:hypothetical protein